MTQLSLSIEDVQTQTGIGRTKVYQAINSGQLRARKLGRRTIILKDDLDAFLANLDAYPSNTRGA